MAVQGEAELEAKIQELMTKSVATQNTVLDEVAKEFAERLESNIPRGAKSTRKTHIKSEVKIGKPRLRQGVREVSIGIQGSSSTGPLPAWRAHFWDTGSLNNPPTFFSERTRDQMSPEIKQAITEAFRETLGTK